MHQHEKLAVWRRSFSLASALQRDGRAAVSYLDRTAWAQIVRAATSVPANVAEGAMRSSARDFARFLSIAIGSAAELHTLLLLAETSGLLPEAQARDAAAEALQLRRMLVALRARILSRASPPRPA